jgi:hypothetical protein
MYIQIFKDFAGPLATVIAAIAAVSVTAYFAWHQRKIASEQAHIARERLRYDLFDRRLEIFTSIFPLYHALISWEATPEQIVAKDRFLRAYHESSFLFKKESGIEQLLKSLNDDANKVIGIKEMKSDLQTDKNLYLRLFKEMNEIQVQRFPDGLDRLKYAMAEYLNFHTI